jgi:hypothetical protein
MANRFAGRGSGWVTARSHTVQRDARHIPHTCLENLRYSLRWCNISMGMYGILCNV